MSLAAGTQLGPYEIQSAIGAGGMGEVYRARDTRLDRTVAIKVLPTHLAADPHFRERFAREAHAIAALNHPHICALYDVGEEHGRTFLVMEHLAGETLDHRLKKGPLALAPSLDIAAQIADALDAAHKQGIVHRDLKPANVMLTKAGTKLLDFGLAKLKSLGEPPAIARDETMAPTRAGPLTGAGIIVGTPQYMAPEELEGKQADARTDLWALGAILFEMLAGRPAFQGSSAASLVGAILNREPPPLATLQPLTPASLERLIKRCLAKSPDDRWDSAHDVADELRWIRQSSDSTAAAQERRPAAPRRNRRRLIASILGVGALAAVVSALSFFRDWRLSAGAGGHSVITSVAVLPLENLSGDANQQYFADGLTDSLINELAQIHTLRVISRTSVMRYKGTRKPVQEIARELNGVGAIVEGTVMRDAGRVAITVQLIDAASDVHLWSQGYDRDLGDILTLRKEIAQSVAQGIRAATAPSEQRRLDRREKVNPEAFEYYLRTIDFNARGTSAENARATLEAARKAVSLDPRFPEGYAALARANAVLWWYYWDRSPARASEARAAANKALALDPLLPDAHRAKGEVDYWLALDYESALQEFSTALEGNPSDSESLFNIGAVKRRQGRVDEAVAYIRRALELNPLDANISFNLGESYALLRQPEEAERHFDNALRLDPAFNRPFAYKLRWRLRVRPELMQGRQVEQQAEAAGLGAEPLVLYHRVLLHIYSGDDSAALDLLALSPVEVFEEQFWFVPTALLRAQIYNRLGQRAKAREQFAEARRLAEARLRADPDATHCRSALGLALAGLGESAAAIREGKAAVDGMPVTREAYRGAYRLEDLARIYAVVGERDPAVELLTKLLSIPDDLAAPALALDPFWAPLRGHAGFDRLVASVKNR
jgi:eukaryotic-like serine/threonine-protein kinase